MDPFKRFLVPLDGSLAAEAVLDHCLSFGSAFAAEFHLLHVLEHGWLDGIARDGVEWRLRRAEAVEYLEGVADRLRADGLDVQTRAVEGTAATEIASVAHSWNADLIFLCSHGHGEPDGFDMGSVAGKVISRAGVSIMLVPPAPPPGEDHRATAYERVIVPVDCSRRGDWALSVGARIARAGGGKLHALHVITVPEYPERAAADFVNRVHRTRLIEASREVVGHYLATLEEKYAWPDLEVSSSLLESSSVVRSLTGFARSAHGSLMVVTAHGESGDSPWPYGSVAGHLVMHTRTPLLVLQDLPRRAFTAPDAAPYSALELSGQWDR